MQRKKVRKSMVALSIAAVMIMETFAPCADVFAQGTQQEEQLAQELLNMEEEYPQGAFAFDNSQITLNEGEKTEIVLLRKGNRENEAKVSLRAVDVSALYSKDYTLTVKEGAFLSRTLEGGSDKTLTDSFTEAQKEETPAEETETPKEEETPAGEAEAPKEEESPAEETEAPKEEESPAEEAEASKEEETPAEEAPAEEMEAGEVKMNTEEGVEKEFRGLEGQSSLQAARDAQLGQQTEKVDWTEVTPDNAEYEQIRQMTEEGGEQVEQFAEGIDGVRYDFTFKPGEYKKVISIETMDDAISESDEQIMLMLFAAENAELADTQTAYINIQDNDEKEESVFYVGQTDIYVERGASYAEVPICRTGGTERISGVTVGTSAETAKFPEDYSNVQEDIIFPQGVTEQTVKIPLAASSETTGEVTFFVGLKGKGSQVDESANAARIHIVDPGTAEAVSMSNMEKSGRSSENEEITINKKIEASGENRETMYRLERTFDLSTAESVTIQYDVDAKGGRSWTEGSGCNKTNYHSESTVVTAEAEGISQTAKHTGNTNNQSIKIDISGQKNRDVRKTDAKIKVGITPVDGNDKAKLTIDSVTVEYTGYKFKIVNSEEGNEKRNPEAFYQEKQYYSDNLVSGKNYGNGVGMWLGQAQFDGGAVSQEYYKPEQVEINYLYNSNAKNSAGIAPDESNTEFVGLKIKKGQKEIEIPNSTKGFKFDKEFIEKYADYMSNNETFELYPVFKPKNTGVYLAEAEGKTYSWKSGSGKFIECKALDTVMVQAISNDNERGIEEISAANVLRKGNAIVFSKEIGDTMAKQMSKGETPFVEKTIEQCSGKDYIEQTSLGTPLEDAVKVLAGGGETAMVVPTTPLFVYASTSTYQVTVKALEGGRNLDQVEAFDENGESFLRYKGGVVYAKGDELLAGDPAHELVIDGLKKNESIRLNSVIYPDENGEILYKANWYEDTLDTDGDGVTDTDETQNGGSYDEMTPTMSSSLVFPVKRNNIVLKYDFREIRDDVSGFLEGNIFLKEKEIFTGDAEEVPLKNATVSADDQSAVTGENKEITKSKYKTDGYYYLQRQGWERSDYLFVNVQYQGNIYTFTQNPKKATKQVIPGDYPISVQNGSAKVYLKDENGNYNSIPYGTMSNGNNDYRIEVKAVSADNAVVPKQAVMRFYGKDGAVKSKELLVDQTPLTITNDAGEQETIENSGIFQFDFNPEKEGFEAGTTMKIQFIDQNGYYYYEQPTGISLTKSLGMLSFVNSMGFSGTAGFLGALDAKFDLGWSGNFDNGENVITQEIVTEKYTDASGETVEKTETMKSIVFGFDFAKDKVLEKDTATEVMNAANAVGESDLALTDAKKELKKLKKQGASSDKIKEQQKAVEDAEAAKKEAKDTYKQSVKDNKDPKKSSTKLAFNASLDTSFSLSVRTKYDEEKQDWYYHDMILSVSIGANASTKLVYKTPVGIDLILTVDVGLGKGVPGETGTAGEPMTSVMTVSSKNSEKYYISSATEDADGNKAINIFDSDMDNADRMFDYNGAFNVAPRLGIEGKVGSDLLSTSVGADISALFDLYYYTNPTISDEQTLKINGGMFVEILTMKFRYDFGTSEIDLGGGNADTRTAMLSNVLDTGTNLYDSIDVMQPDKRSYLKNRSQWGKAPKSASVSEDAKSSFKEQVLMTGVYENSDIQFADLGNGNVLAVYLDADPSRSDINSTALYYSIYQNGNWADPEIIENDGTVDDSPSIADLGSKGIMVAWSTADKEFDDSADTIDLLESRNIHTALFSKEKMSFGKVQKATKTTEDDITGDVQPVVTYYKTDAGERMLLYYSKNEYTRTNTEEGVLGDAVNPYSAMAYMYYDFENKEWRQHYTEEEKQTIIDSGVVTEDEFASYEENWYGQKFLRIAPVVSVEETLDESGFWEKEPVIREIQYGQDGYVMPTVVDSDAVTYNGLALIAFTLDRDSNLQTESDRDVYMQIYDYKDDTFTHPIMITSDTVADQKVKLTRTENGTYMTWISDSKIYMQDISSLIGGGHYVKAETTQGEEYYYLDKSKGSGYIPPTVIASYERDNDVLAEGNADAGRGISDYDIQANGSDVYILWTESSSKLREGIDPETADTSKGSNYETTRQIYGSRFNSETGQWSGRVQITDTAGANYKDIDASVRDDGSLLIMAEKTSNKVISAEENEGYETSVQDEAATSLVSLSVTPQAEPEIVSLEMETPKAGETAEGQVSIENKGFLSAEGLTLKVEDEQGNVLLEEKDMSLISGAGNTYNFTYKLPEKTVGSADWKVTAKLTQSGDTVSEKSEQGSVVGKAELGVLSVVQTESRDEAEISLTAVNNGFVTSPAETVDIAVSEGGKAVKKLEIPKLAPGESVEVSEKIAVKDEMFAAGTDEYENPTETMTVYASLGEDIQTAQIVRMTPKEVADAFKSIKETSIDKIEIEGGERVDLDSAVKIESDEFEYDEFTTFENYGIDVKWYVEDESVAEVTSDDLLIGLKKGTTTLHGVVMPASYTGSFTNSGESYDISPVLTLTSDMFKEIETKVTVKNDAVLEPEDPNGNGNSSTDGNDTGSGSSNSKPTKTGDESEWELWLMLMAVSILAAGYGISRKRKNNK